MGSVIACAQLAVIDQRVETTTATRSQGQQPFSCHFLTMVFVDRSIHTQEPLKLPP